MNYFDILLAKKLNGGGGGDITVESLSVTENGTYTAPQGKAYTPVTVEVQPPANSYRLKSITTPTSLATFEASAMPMPSIKVSVEAKQDLHGYDKPWVGGAGKNKYDKNNANNQPNKRVSTGSGGTYAADGYTATYLVEVKPDTDYTLTTSSNFVSYICWYDETQARIGGTNWSSGTSKTSPSNAKYVRFDFSTADIDTVQLELGSTATSYEPYENICPIEGWDAAVVTDTDDVDNPTVTQTTTITLPQTVYGGELNVVNGTSGNKITHQLETISGGITRTDSSGYLFVVKDLDVPDITDYETVTPYIISNYLTPYSVNDLRANAVFGFTQYNKRLYIRLGADITTVADANAYLASNNLQIKYELATPTTLTTQPTPIKSLNGINNLSVDCGEILEGEYFKALGGA